MRCCGKPQAVWGWVGSSLLDSGVPLPPGVCPGSPAKCVNCRGSGPKRRNPAVTSEPPGHLPWRPVWELLLPGQWNKEKVCFCCFFSLVNRDNTDKYMIPAASKNSLRTHPETITSDHNKQAPNSRSLVIHKVNSNAQSHSTFHY